MLYARLNEKASVVKQNTPFDYDINLCELMSASAMPYILGNKETLFEVSFSIQNEPALEGEPAVPEYSIIYTEYIKLTESELINWGTDDKEALIAIAKKYNVTIIGYVE